MENKNAAWNRFIKSGRIDDYLDYCKTKKEDGICS